MAVPELTREQDLIDLGLHQKASQPRKPFAYTVMNPDESRCLRCVHIDPTAKRGLDAEVYLWVRKSELDRRLDATLYHAVKKWVAGKWPLEKAAYPGRESTGRRSRR